MNRIAVVLRILYRVGAFYVAALGATLAWLIDLAEPDPGARQLRRERSANE